MNNRIVLTRPLPGEPLDTFAAAGLPNVWVNPRDERLSRVDLLDAVRDASAVIATPADVQINAEFFDVAGDQLVIVSNYAVGVDNIDLDEAGRRRITIGHTPHAVTEPTADAAWLLMLAACRRAREGLDLARSGRRMIRMLARATRFRPCRSSSVASCGSSGSPSSAAS